MARGQQTPAARRRAAIPPVPVVEKLDPDLDTNSDLDTGEGDEETPPHVVGNISGERLLSFITRIERLNEEKKTLSDDIKEIKSEAKGAGFDVAVINHLIKERKKDKDDLDEFNTQVDIYKRAIGMLPEI